MEPAAMSELLAESAIRRVISTYARAVDRLDWDALHNCYHADAIDEHGVYNGDVDGFVDFLRKRMGRFVRTMHIMANPLIEVHGDTADVETYCTAYHRLRADAHGVEHDWTLRVRYLDRFEQRAGQWRIARRTVVYESDRFEVATPTQIPPDRLRGERHEDTLIPATG